MDKKPEILSTEMVAKSQLFSIEKVHLRFSNGVERHFERMLGRGRGAVLIIPMLDDETILLVREYAAGIEDYILSFPTGLCEADETVLTAANREMQEEVGFASHELKLLCSLNSSSAYSTAVIHIVLAKNLYPSALPGDEPEALQVVPWKLSDYRALLERSDFSDARNVCAVLMVREYLRGDV